MTNPTHPAHPRTEDAEVLDPATLDAQRARRLNPALGAMFAALYAAEDAIRAEPTLRGADGWREVLAALSACSTRVQQGLATAGWELPEDEG